MAFEEWAENEIASLEQGTKIIAPSPHQSLFKYIGLNSEESWGLFEETINNKSLSGSTTKSLNDPFELRPCLFDDLTPNVIVKAIRHPGLPLDDDIDIPDISDLFGDRKKYSDLSKKRFALESHYSRIISFCKRIDSPLLWSHYSNKYQGACMHFLGRAFGRFEMQIGSVEYAIERPVYPLSLALGLNHFVETRRFGLGRDQLQSEHDKIVYFIKASEWSYEQEVRIVYNSNRINKMEFFNEGLVSIIIGPRMPDRSRERLNSIIKSSEFHDIPIREARLSKSSFSIEIDE